MTSIVCDICHRSCKLEEGETGLCGARQNINGENRDRLYGCLHPTPPHLSRGFERQYVAWLPGCNLQCWFCCSPHLSGPTREREYYEVLAPAEFVNEAEAWGARDIMFLRGEPTIHYEWILEVSPLARVKGIRLLLETNAYMQTLPKSGSDLVDAIDKEIQRLRDC